MGQRLHGWVDRLLEKKIIGQTKIKIRKLVKMRKKKILVAVLTLVGLVLLALFVWPNRRYDATQVTPALRALATPYRSVNAECFMDGGSIGLTIVDAHGQSLALALPVSDGAPRYSRLFLGATYAQHTNATEVAFSEDTRRMLISVIDQYRQPHDESAHVLWCLRGAPKDHAGFLLLRVQDFLRQLF